MQRPLVIMGVAGCGKSTFASALAAEWKWRLIEGDDYHPATNVQKMRDGVPLTDADRSGWLAGLGQALLQAGPHTLLTCSALKKTYRDTLRRAVPGLRFVHLQLTPGQARQRVAQRESHYFNAQLVDSQFRDLESPQDEPGVLCLDATLPLAQLCAQASGWMHKEFA